MDYFFFLFSLGVCSCYLVFVSIPYESHTDRRGHPEIRVVELFITEKRSNEVLNDDEEGRRKESTGRRITKRTKFPSKFLRKALRKAQKSFTLLRKALLRKALLYSQKSFTLLLEKLYFTLEKLYFTLKRLFAIESSSQLLSALTLP